MGLTQRIKRESAQVFTTTTGETFLIQKVDRRNTLIESGMMLDMLNIESLEIDEADDSSQIRKMIEGKTREEASSILRGMFGSTAAMLKAGLIGERVPDPSDATKYKDIFFVWTHKDAFNLDEGEININLIPDALQSELMTAIAALGAPPIATEAVARFPEV